MHNEDVVGSIEVDAGRLMLVRQQHHTLASLLFELIELFASLHMHNRALCCEYRMHRGNGRITSAHTRAMLLTDSAMAGI
jgi:hypothetical protein